MNDLSSVKQPLLSTRTGRALAGLGFVAAMASASATPALASQPPPSRSANFVGSAPDEADDEPGERVVFGACGAARVRVYLDAGVESIAIEFQDEDGETVTLVGPPEDLEVGFAEREEVRLEVWLVGNQGGFIELSPDGEPTKLLHALREQTSFNLDEPADSVDETWAQDYLLVGLGPDGQELPAVPKVTIKTKKTCSRPPVDDLPTE